MEMQRTQGRQKKNLERNNKGRGFIIYGFTI